ncbi:MAG: esterase-like activity of phytase family protein [Microcoleaceae cyanobacterium]
MKPFRLVQRLLQVMMLLSLLTACALPQVSAETRMFLDASLDFLGETTLPTGHLSGVTYELQGYGPQTSPGVHLYGVLGEMDSSGETGIYQLKLDLDNLDLDNLLSDASTPSALSVESIIALKDQSGQTFKDKNLQLESIVFTPRNSVFIAAEEVHDGQNIPLIGEFDLQTGQLKNTVPLPPNYRPQTDEEAPQGIQSNFGFHSLTIAPDGFSKGGLDPFRLFATTSAPLLQDLDADGTQLRILHYVIADRASFLVSENLYSLDSHPETDSPSRLIAMVALPETGMFLSLEQFSTAEPGLTPTSSRYHYKIYQVFTGNATDTSKIASLRKPISIVQPLQKKLLLDLDKLDLPSQPLEGMTLGPRLPNGDRSLILISNDPHDTTSPSQFLLFSMKQEA